MSIYKCQRMLTKKASQMKNFKKKKKISSFSADKYDTSLLFFNSPHCVLQHFNNIWITQEENLMLHELSN